MAHKDPLNDTLVEEEDFVDEGLARSRAWLIAIGSPEDNFSSAGKVFPLDGIKRVEFGRSENADGIVADTEHGEMELKIPFGWVSGRHAELHVLDRGTSLSFELGDLGSRNGTLIGGERISGPIRMRSADVFEVGRSFWMIREVRMRKLRTHRLSELDPVGTCSPHLHHIHRTLHRLARSSIPIVIRGETGTGKEFLARAIHRVSGRGAFVVANLAALSDARVESVLFGGDGEPGLFEQADGGTLMLDELGEVSAAVQAKLLSALVEGRAARVGEADSRRFDVRLIASTLHDLTRMVDAGTFRPDLYSRLAGFVAELPPLRARREDLGLLTRSFVTAQQRDGRPTRITSNAFRRLLVHAWPFNVRQLLQTLTTASLLASGDGTITADALAEVLEEDDGLPHSPDEVRRLREELVRRLAEYSGDTEEVARAMNRAPVEIHRWLQRFDLEPERYRA